MRVKKCNRIAWVAASLYGLSLALPAIRPGRSNEVMFGLTCLLAVIFPCPIGLLMHPAAWANFTFATGIFALFRERPNAAAAWGVVSLALAASYPAIVFTSSNQWPERRFLLPGYWVWVAAMAVVATSPVLLKIKGVRSL